MKPIQAAFEIGTLLAALTATGLFAPPIYALPTRADAIEPAVDGAVAMQDNSSDTCGLSAPEEVVTLPLPTSFTPVQQRSLHQPLTFERNEGQTDSAVKFVCRGRAYSLFLTGSEAVLVMAAAQGPLAGKRGGHLTGWSDALPRREGQQASTTVESAPVLRIRPVGGNDSPTVAGEHVLQAKVNYFIGNEPSLWRANIPTFGQVRYREVYPGIDLVYYGIEGQLEYDLVVAPGADPNRIALELEGADDMNLDEGGNLVLQVGGQEVRWLKPVIYQQIGGARHEIAGSFQIRRSQTATSPGPTPGAPAPSATLIQSIHFVSFQLAAYDRSQPLVIDPKLLYATYIGGSGVDIAVSVAVDQGGNAYVAGITESRNFPIKGALQEHPAGGLHDVFVSKLSPAGELLFSTYLGGKDDDGNVWGEPIVTVAISPAGDCYLVGGTLSKDFPVVNPLQAAHGGGDWDAFVTALKNDGSAILFSTYWGGRARDEARNMAFGPTGDLYIVGETLSPDFPIRKAFSPTLSRADTFITRFKSGGESVVYSTYYGRSSNEETPTAEKMPYGLAVDREGNAYVSIKANPMSAPPEWSIIKVNADGNSLLFETAVRPSPGSWPAMLPPFIALAPGNRVVIAGGTSATDLPAVNEPNTTTDPWGEVYVAQLDSRDGSFISGAYLGGAGHDWAKSVFVDSTGDIIVVGWTSGQLFDTGFPVTDLTEPAPDPGMSGDIFVTKFRSSDLSVTFSTLLGGAGDDYPNRPALDRNGNLLIPGYTTDKFPAVNAFQPQPGGNDDGFLLKFSFADGPDPGTGLTISCSGRLLALSWPAAATGYQLQRTESLSEPVWSTVAGTPAIERDQSVLTLEVGTGAMFFRLVKP